MSHKDYDMKLYKLSAECRPTSLRNGTIGYEKREVVVVHTFLRRRLQRFGSKVHRPNLKLGFQFQEPLREQLQEKSTQVRPVRIMGERSGSCGDVLLVPMGQHGHVTPLIYVAEGLMKHGLTMTMLLEEDKRETMDKHMDVANSEGFHLELVMSIDKLEPKGDPGFVGNSTNVGRVCEPFLQRVLEEVEAGGKRPKCMIADQFMGWTQNWADKLKIPRYVLMCSPAAFGYAMYMYAFHLEQGVLSHVDENPVLDLPGAPEIHLGDITGAAIRTPEFITYNGSSFADAAGMLFNTFHDLEVSTIDGFRDQVKSHRVGRRGPKMLPVGPMLPPEFFSEGTFEGTAKDSPCIQWLDTQSPSSVVYVAFGSNAHLDPPQIQELAKGLEASKQPFLWILRIRPSKSDPAGQSKDISTILPPGFLERTKDQGLVFSEFAPQLQILSHPSTGGFLTHCGWNSSLEAICRGVPMIGWTLGAEQKLCCRVLEAAHVAKAIRPGLTTSRDLVKSEEVAKALAFLMVEPEGKQLKARARELQRQARQAMAPDGSSIRNVATLVRDVQNYGV